MMMVVLGLMLASVGQDTLSDIPRFVFNNMNLADGISFVLVVMATFAMSEALSIILKEAIRHKLRNKFHYQNLDQ